VRTFVSAAAMAAMSGAAHAGEGAFSAEAALHRINDARQSEGLSPLGPDPSLMKAAALYAEDMRRREEISHYGADGSTPPTRAAAAGYPGEFVTEALAAGQSTLEEVVDAWLDSPPHRAALLAPEGAHLGVALHEDPASTYQTYWTVLVAAPD
jgi:uncharacterized protein YkwD